MWYLPCRFVSPIPTDPTQRVDAELVDAGNRVWRFRDKLAIFRGGGEDGVRCTLLRLGRLDAQLAYWVSTAAPDGVARLETDETELITRHARFSSQPLDHEDELASIPRAPGLIDIDVLQHAIAVALHVLPPQTSFVDAKPLYWSAGDDVGDFTLVVIQMLLSRGELEQDPHDTTLLRWSAR